MAGAAKTHDAARRETPLSLSAARKTGKQRVETAQRRTRKAGDPPPQAGKNGHTLMTTVNTRTMIGDLASAGRGDLKRRGEECSEELGVLRCYRSVQRISGNSARTLLIASMVMSFYST